MGSLKSDHSCFASNLPRKCFGEKDKNHTEIFTYPSFAHRFTHIKAILCFFASIDLIHICILVPWGSLMLSRSQPSL